MKKRQNFDQFLITTYDTDWLHQWCYYISMFSIIKAMQYTVKG